MSAPQPDPLWPTYDQPGDLKIIESLALEDRGLPGSTYDVLARAAALWPDRSALTVLPSAEQWTHGKTVGFAQLRDEVHRIANLFHQHGVRRTTAEGLLTPNTGLLPATLLAAGHQGQGRASTKEVTGRAVFAIATRAGVVMHVGSLIAYLRRSFEHAAKVVCRKTATG